MGKVAAVEPGHVAGHLHQESGVAVQGAEDPSLQLHDRSARIDDGDGADDRGGDGDRHEESDGAPEEGRDGAGDPGRRRAAGGHRYEPGSACACLAGSSVSPLRLRASCFSMNDTRARSSPWLRSIAAISISALRLTW